MRQACWILTACAVMALGSTCDDNAGPETAPEQMPPEQAEATEPFPEEQVPPPEPQPEMDPAPAPPPKVTVAAPPREPDPVPVVVEPDPTPVDTSVTAGRASSPQPTDKYAPAPTSTSRTHTVRKGETLYSLAKRYYGSSTRWRRIYEANRQTVKDPNVISIGMKLRIP